jgi:urease accessory protein
VTAGRGMQSAGMILSTPEKSESSFHANRARGRVELIVEGSGGESRVVRRREEGSSRVRFPAHSDPPEAVLLNNAGGIAGGDIFEVAVRLGDGARLTVTTAAAEKIYRSLGPSSRVDIRIVASGDASLAWLPQETIMFDRARLERSIEIDLDPGARLVFVEALVLGRGAMGETVAGGLLKDRWRVRRGGRLVYADGVRLDGDMVSTLASFASAGGAVALATVLMVPGNDEIVAAVREREPAFRGEVGASSWHGIAAARLVSRDGAALRHDLALVLTAAGCALPRLWLG